MTVPHPKRELANTDDLLRSEHVYLFHYNRSLGRTGTDSRVQLQDDGKTWVEYTCLNCGMNIRFDPEFNDLYSHPKGCDIEDLKCQEFLSKGEST